MSTLYRRRPRSPFRVLDGQVMIGGVGHGAIGIGGAATFVWLVLDRARTSDDIASEIAVTWPELGEIDRTVVDETLAVLLDRGLIEQTSIEQTSIEQTSEDPT